MTSPLPLAQGVSLFGIWGMTFIAIAVFASPAVLADDRGETRWPFMPAALAGLTLVALTAFGGIRLARNPTVMVEGVRMRIMQPNVPQDDRFNYNAKQQIMSRYVALSEGGAGANGLRDVNFLIWPESAFPFFIAREPDALAMIANMLAPDTVLLTGAASLAEQVRAAPVFAPTIRSSRSTTTARFSPDTTSFIWCRSANSCRSRMRSNASA